MRKEARQIHQDVVLTTNAQVEQPPVLDARHGGDGECFVETQKDVRQRGGSHANRETGPALNRLSLRIDTCVDAVVEHVVLAQRIIAVEATTCGELGDRGVQRDGASILPAEQGDVFRLLRRTRVGKRVEFARIDFGEEVVGWWEQVPRLRAEILKVDVERSVRFARKDLQCAPCQPFLWRARGEARHRHALLVIRRTQPDVRLFERRRQRVVAREELHLAALGSRRRREPHLTAPDQHKTCHALIALDEIDRAFLQSDDEILGCDLEIARAERPVRVHPKLVQALDRGESLGANEAPRFDVPAGRTPDIHTRSEDSRFASRLDEELDDEAIAVARGCALEWRAGTLAKRGSHSAADQQVVGVLFLLAFRDRRSKEREQARTIAPVQRAFELADHRLGRIGLPRLRGEWRGPENRARQDEKPSDHWCLALLDAN